ncbi:MAG: serine hydrolase, partial [Albidovulum sp.]
MVVCPGQCVSRTRFFLALALAWLLLPLAALAAPYADFVIDVRTGEVLHQENADTRLHPASLTKMMTLYIAFEAIERGEITLDSKVTISRHAASQPPSRLGLKPGQTIALRYLIRAAAIKSANDAATAIAEAIEGSEPAFAKRMNRTAKALGMTRSTFVNANGLTAKGHLSTARDMTILGRHLFYDYPQYYNIFSRTSADAGVAQVASTNRRFLAAYKGADGIKTGYTQAAGFNLVASAHRGNKHVIATIFGGKSTADRNARAAQLLDLGFGKAPERANVQKPARPAYTGIEAPDLLVQDMTDENDAMAEAVARAVTTAPDAVPAGKTIRLKVAVAQSPRPRSRPQPGSTAPAELPAEAPLAPATEELLLAMQDDIATALAEAHALALAETPASEDTAAPPAKAAAVAATTVTPDAATGPTGPVFAQTATPQPETALALAATAMTAAADPSSAPAVLASRRPTERPASPAGSPASAPETGPTPDETGVAEAVVVATAEPAPTAEESAPAAMADVAVPAAKDMPAEVRLA